MNVYCDNNLENEINFYKSNYDDDKILLIGKKDLIGYLSHWSIKLSPLEIPRNLEIVLEKFTDHINPYFEKLIKNNLQFLEMDIKTLSKFLYGNLITIQEFKKWNLSEMELKLSIDINDERGEYCNQIIGLNTKEDPLYDIVDLDALIRNISHSIYNDQF